MKLDCKCIVNFGEIKDQPGQIRITPIIEPTRSP